MNKKYTPIARGQPLLQTGVCGFLLWPQLSSDKCDKCDCLNSNNSNNKFQGPWGESADLSFVLDLNILNISYLMPET